MLTPSSIGHFTITATPLHITCHRPSSTRPYEFIPTHVLSPCEQQQRGHFTFYQILRVPFWAHPGDSFPRAQIPAGRLLEKESERSCEMFFWK